MRTTLIFIIVAFIFNACAPSPETKAEIIAPDIIPIIITPPETIPGVSPSNIIITFQADNKIKFWDGSALTVWKSESGNHAGFRQIAVADKLYILEQRGIITAEKNIIGTYDSTIADGADVWSLYNIPPAEAESLGMMYKDYTKIYLNAIEYGTWQSRPYKTLRFIKSGSDILAYGNTGGWRHINGSKTGFRAVNEDFNIYDVNTTLKTGKINLIDISYTLNFFLASEHYQKSGSTWYSWNGYKWDGSSIIQTGCALEAWRQETTYPITLSEAAVLIGAGTRIEAGETVLYYIECNSGYLFRYVPSTNIMSQKTRLYVGDGTRATGLYYANILKPVAASDAIYFCFDDGGIYRYKFDTNLTGYLTTGADWIKGWE